MKVTNKKQLLTPERSLKDEWSKILQGDILPAPNNMNTAQRDE